jgi:2,5-diketo-D-gluconate reductase A
VRRQSITAIADGCDRTPVQVLIRWRMQVGNIVVLKSVNPMRIASSFDVLDMASISSLDSGSRLGPNPRTFDFRGR